MYRIHAVVVSLVLCLVFALDPAHPEAMHASGPCDAVSGAPAPPVPPTDPTWTGAVLDTSESSVISGATARIYRCDSGSATEIATTTTDSSGEFSFTVSGGHHYFVQLDMTGPLANMTVSSGYQNPTSALGLGDPADVDMGFE